MNKNLIIILVAVLLICVNLSGCNEPKATEGAKAVVNDDETVVNDDKAFLRKADAIVDNILPPQITEDNGVDGYRLELSEYELSVECEKIRQDLYTAFDTIEDLEYYGSKDFATYYEYVLELHTLATEQLKSIRSDIEKLK